MKIEWIATFIFACAVLHTFMTGSFEKASHKWPEGSSQRALFHFFAEIEVVFGLWAAVFLCFLGAFEGPQRAVDYIDGLDFTEPAFVFAIMTVCSSRPILLAARSSIVMVSSVLSRLLPGAPVGWQIAVILVMGALGGSLITEPAAMTLCALLLAGMIRTHRSGVLHFLLAVLFVNISIGGALTSFAAPPVLMVAKAWGWDSAFVFSHFGWKAAIACVVNAALFLAIFRGEIKSGFTPLDDGKKAKPVPMFLTLVHFLFLLLVILTAHHPKFFLGGLLFFLGLVQVSASHQETLRLRQSLLVAFFLAGLIVLGPYQRWWLQPLLSSLDDLSLFIGATGLTAITDNAALTYLGAQVPTITEASKYALVAGALAGGGLTLIANAPNLAGATLLESLFPHGIQARSLFLSALLPTMVAMLAFWLL